MTGLLYGSDHCFTPAAAVAMLATVRDEQWSETAPGPWRRVVVDNAQALFRPVGPH